MADRPALSKGEMEVARVLWDQGKGTVREVHAAFPDDRDIDFATVQTYLRRLESKGYVQSRTVGRVKEYRPKVKPSTVIRSAVNDFVDRLFGGQTLPLMRHLIEDRGVDTGDIAQLRKLLDDLEQDANQ